MKEKESKEKHKEEILGKQTNMPHMLILIL